MENDLTTEQIEKELAELIGQSKDKVEPQEPEMVVCDVEDTANKDIKIRKEFVSLSKDDFDKLSRREQLEYKILLSKNRTEQLKKEYQDFKTKQSKAARSAETKKLIIMGRFLKNQLEREDRTSQYETIGDHLNEYLTNNTDRLLLGFPLLPKSEEDH